MVEDINHMVEGLPELDKNIEYLNSEIDRLKEVLAEQLLSL